MSCLPEGTPNHKGAKSIYSSGAVGKQERGTFSTLVRLCHIEIAGNLEKPFECKRCLNFFFCCEPPNAQKGRHGDGDGAWQQPSGTQP